MGWFGDDNGPEQASNDYDNIGDGEHKAKLSHELLAGAASYYAARKYEEHESTNGKPASHQEAKELLAGFAGAFVDREAESKGLDFIDREKVKNQAQDQINSVPPQDNGYQN
ncbi:hypothetical protein DV736_g2948, partial [Chaetothyriales sp. CBS 134916]